MDISSRVVGPIDLPKIDLQQYVGKEAEIESAITFKGGYGYYVKVMTKAVGKIGDGETAKELKASKILGLQADPKDEKRLGWGKGTAMDTFLNLMKVKHYNELPGKTVVLKTVKNEDTEKTYLTF